MSKFQVIVLCGLMAAPATAWAEDLAPTALNSMSMAPANIASIQVMDQKGQVIGQALRVQTDQDGRPAALSFRANNGSTVVIAASATGYDGHALITSDDQPQIAALSGVRTAAAN